MQHRPTNPEIIGIVEEVTAGKPAPETLAERYGEAIAREVGIVLTAIHVEANLADIEIEDSTEAQILGETALQDAGAVLKYLGGEEGAREKMGGDATSLLMRLYHQQSGA